MIGHLGSRVSALLDGQLSPAEAERAWSHVHGCHACRDLVEREGWVKTQLSSLSGDAGAPEQLKGSLLGSSVLAPPAFATYDGRSRRHVGMVALGGSAVGAVVMGALVLASLPGDAPDRRPPTTSFERQTEPPVARLSGGTPLPGVELTRSPRR